MTPEEMVGESRPLAEWIARLGSFPGDGWLYVRASPTTVSLGPDTECWPIVVRGTDCAPEEQEALDRYLERRRLTSFLNQDQLIDVRENLRQQRPEYSSEDLYRAITFYCDRDAFIDVDRA